MDDKERIRALHVLLDALEVALKDNEEINGLVLSNDGQGVSRASIPARPVRLATTWDGLLVAIAESSDGYYLNYVLDERGEPLPTNDLKTVDRCLRDAKARTVARTCFVYRGLPVEVSTVFLVLNHAFTAEEPPILWETMVFTRQPDIDGFQARYQSRSDAERCHEAAVQATRAALRVLTRRSRRRALVAQRRKVQEGSSL